MRTTILNATSVALLGSLVLACSGESQDEQDFARTQESPSLEAGDQVRKQGILVRVKMKGPVISGNVDAILSDGHVFLDDIDLGSAEELLIDPKTGEQLMEFKGAVCSTAVGCTQASGGTWTNCASANPTPIDYCFDNGPSCSATVPCPGSFSCVSGTCQFSTNQRTEIRDALAMWADKPGSRFDFVEKTCAAAAANSRLKFTPAPSSCTTPMGRKTGGNDIRLGPNCFGATGGSGTEPLITSRGIIAHEIGHSLGLAHEHQRKNRNFSVFVDTASIESGMGSAYTEYTTTQNVGAYDTSSLMHYASWSFAAGLTPPMVVNHRWTMKYKQTCNSGVNCTSTWQNGLGTQFAPTAGLVGDFNNDGRDDVLLFPDGLFWDYVSGGTGPFSRLRFSSISTNLFVGDFDGDDFRDDILHVSDTGIRIYKNGSGAEKLVLSVNVPATQILIGDFNQDGQDDIFQASGTAFRVAYGQGMNAAGEINAYASFTNLVSDTRTVPQLAIGDFDGDGFNDDVFATFSNQWQVRMNGTGAWSVLKNDTTPRSLLQFGKVDANATTDVLLQTPPSGTSDFPRLSFASAGSGSFVTIGAAVPPLDKVLVGNFDAQTGIDLISDGLIDRQRTTIQQADLDAAHANCPL